VLDRRKVPNMPQIRCNHSLRNPVFAGFSYVSLARKKSE
jgi:hypothetical protein